MDKQVGRRVHDFPSAARKIMLLMLVTDEVEVRSPVGIDGEKPLLSQR